MSQRILAAWMLVMTAGGCAAHTKTAAARQPDAALEQLSTRALDQRTALPPLTAF